VGGTSGISLAAAPRIVHPDSITREDLAEQLGYHPRTKSFTNSLSALRSPGFIDYPSPGWVAACDVLYLEGR
jgi:hypothetical protein